MSKEKNIQFEGSNFATKNILSSDPELRSFSSSNDKIIEQKIYQLSVSFSLDQHLERIVTIYSQSRQSKRATFIPKLQQIEGKIFWMKVPDEVPSKSFVLTVVQCCTKVMELSKYSTRLHPEDEILFIRYTCAARAQTTFTWQRTFARSTIAFAFVLDQLLPEDLSFVRPWNRKRVDKRFCLHRKHGSAPQMTSFNALFPIGLELESIPFLERDFRVSMTSKHAITSLIVRRKDPNRFVADD